jgi:hypothetical protein
MRRNPPENQLRCSFPLQRTAVYDNQAIYNDLLHFHGQNKAKTEPARMPIVLPTISTSASLAAGSPSSGTPMQPVFLPPPPSSIVAPPSLDLVTLGRGRLAKYSCSICLKSWHSKKSLKDHEPVCRLFQQSRRELQQMEDSFNETTPTILVLYQAFKELLKRMDVMEKQMGSVKRMQSRQMTDLERLNLKYPASSMMGFDAWKKHTFHTECVEWRHLETVYRTRLQDGIAMVLHDVASSSKDSERNPPLFPILSFSNSRTIYVCGNDQDNEWKPLSPSSFVAFIEFLQQKFITYYQTWRLQNFDAIFHEEMYTTMDTTLCRKIYDDSPATLQNLQTIVRQWIVAQTEALEASTTSWTSASLSKDETGDDNEDVDDDAAVAAV